jgi:hypothetical protein
LFKVLQVRMPHNLGLQIGEISSWSKLFPHFELICISVWDTLIVKTLNSIVASNHF